MDNDREKLFFDNQGLIGYTLKRLAIFPQSDIYEDYFQVGCIGLWKAAKDFDPCRGNKFASYAVPMIDGSIRQWKRDCENAVHIPRSMKDKYSKYFYMNCRGVSDDEICSELGIGIEELNGLLAANQYLQSLDAAPTTESENLKLIDLMQSSSNVQDEVTESIGSQETMEMLQDALTEREFSIAKMRIAGMAQDEIARSIGLSQANVSRIINKLKFKIKEALINFNEGGVNVLKYEKQVAVIKKWLVEHPMQPVKISQALRNTGLEIVNGYQTVWKKQAAKELAAEGFNVVWQGPNLLINPDTGNDDVSSFADSKSRKSTEKEDDTVDNTAFEQYFSFSETIEACDFVKIGKMIAGLSNHPVNSGFKVKILVEKLSEVHDEHESKHA